MLETIYITKINDWVDDDEYYKATGTNERKNVS